MFLTVAHCKPSVASKTNAFIITLRTSRNGLQRAAILGLHLCQQRRNRRRGRRVGEKTPNDGQQLASDEARAIRRQKYDHLSDVSRLAESANQFIVSKDFSPWFRHHRLE